MLKSSNRLLDAEKGINQKKYFLCYTFLFAVTALLVNMVFIRDGITYVKSVDGYTQHVVALEYYGQWLRDFFTVLFTEHRFEIKDFDFSIGMGSDVVTTLNYYAIGDPLNLFSVFVPREYTAHLYTALAVLRNYLAGVAFSIYCINRKHKNAYGILAASLLYAFSVFGVVAGPMHPFFINAMIYLPLMFTAVEKIFENNNPIYLSLIVLVAEISNFYFFYMLVFATVVYVLIRLFSIYSLKIKKMLAPLFKIALSALTGVLLGAVIFYPVVMAFLSDGRVSVEHSYPLFYDLRYYFNLFLSPVYYNGFEPWTLVGSGVLFLYASAALFLSKKKNTGLKLAFLVCTAGLCLPAFGGFSNGFSYACNRWCFIFTFVIAYACSLMWEDMLFSKNKLKGLLTAFFPCLYAGICVYIPFANRDMLKLSLVFVAFSSVIFAFSTFFAKGRKIRSLVQLSVIIVNICFISLNAYYVYNSASASHYTAAEVDSAVSAEYAAVEKQKALTGEKDFSRYTSNKLDYNDAVRNGGYGTQYYWSLSDRSISDFQDSVFLNEGFYQYYNGFDDIAVFNTLSSVKYYYDKTEKEGAVPYGFDKTENENLYVNRYALPLIYSYDGYVTKERFDALSTSPEKQQLMLEGAVLEQRAAFTAEENPAVKVEVSPFEVIPESDFVTVEGNTFTVTKRNSKVTLKLKSKASGEAYLSFRDINYRATSPTELYGDNKEVDPLGLFTEETLKQQGIASLAALSQKEWNEPEYLDFITSVTDGKGVSEKRKMKFYTPYYRFYAGKKDCDLYLGYSDEGFGEVVLTFPRTGIYSFGEISVISQDMSFYADGVEKLTDGMKAEIKTDTDKITASVSLEENRLLCFAVPYSKGWSVYVDGEKQPLYKANIMHMAVEVSSGDHEIELTYSSPYRKTGAIISFAGLVLLFSGGMWYYYTRKKNKSI